MINTKKIFVNTGAIYIQTVLTIFITLYTSKIILNALGVVDFGIYSIVGGIITMFGFLNTSMTVSTQRHLMYDLGKGDLNSYNNNLNASIIIHLLIALLVLVIAELFFLMFFDKIINIPLSRLEAAKWIFHFVVLSFMCTIINVPYQAVLNSHENMIIIACINIFGNISILFVSFMISFTPVDRLKMYSVLIFVVNFITFILYYYICRYKYSELTFKFYKNKEAYKELAGYAGWNMAVAVARATENQGVGVVLNIFLGPLINAAYGIGNQVNSAMINFSQAIIRAANPQITKYYAINNIDTMYDLVYKTTKYAYIILILLSFPVIVEIDFILKLWLIKVPPYTSEICTMLLINALIEVFSFPLMTVAQATGNIKFYQLSNTLLIIMNMPLAYVVLKYGGKPYEVLYVMQIITMLALISRLVFIHYLAGMKIIEWLKNTVLKVSIPSIATMVILQISKRIMPSGILRLIVVILLDVAIIVSMSYITVIDENEKYYINEILKKGRKLIKI